jgi:hypothetical protein
MAPEEAGRAGAERRGVRSRRIDAKPEGRAIHGNPLIDALGASSERSQAMLNATGRAGWKKRLDRRGGKATMSDMQKDERVTIRISGKERAKVAECAELMGISEGEFMRRSMQIMLMVMGDQESKAAIHGMIDAATKMGAGLPPVPPKAGVTSTPPRRQRGRKEKVGR